MFMKNKVTKWKEISRETVFQKYSRKIEKVIYELPGGKKAEFYLKREGPTVCVLGITKNKEIILAKQFRPGPNEILLEIPGGGIEEGETAEQAAARELFEETGYRGKVQLISDAFDCAYSTMHRHCLIATDCEKKTEPQNTDSEITEVELLSLEEFRKLLRSGKMTDVEVGYLGLDYLGLL